ncbi:MAG: hypothetical protein Kow0031_13070 [Anaerolineae bacterium]
MANILVIDDDKDIQRLLEFTLKRAGHAVDAAFDGVQGLQNAELNPPDLIVCDVMMPKMTGYEFCRQARTKSALKKTPIIVFSARFQPIDKQTALDAGATDYLPKNTAPDALVNRIAELLPSKKEPPAGTARGVVAVYSLRGGVGVSSLAANLAVAITLAHKTPATLLDLAPMGGHLALMLGLRPTSNLNQIFGNSTNLQSADAIRPHLLKHKTGVQLLASTPGFGQNESFHGNRLLNLMSTIKAGLPVSVLDIPQLLEPQVSPVLQLVDKLVLVLSPDMPSVQAAVTTLQGLARLGYSTRKILPVLNQINPANGLPAETIQKTLRMQFGAIIPFEADMTKATNTGKPLLLLSPQCQASAAMAQLAARLFA